MSLCYVNDKAGQNSTLIDLCLKSAVLRPRNGETLHSGGGGGELITRELSEINSGEKWE